MKRESPELVLLKTIFSLCLIGILVSYVAPWAYNSSLPHVGSFLAFLIACVGTAASVLFVFCVACTIAKIT